MKIRMLTTAAGPGWSGTPRQIVDRPDEEARQLVAGRYAEYVDAPAEAASAPVVEEATAEPADEKAEAPEASRTRRRGR